ncbi:MAG TPA: polysaccharide lyase family protein [Candidatus Paceibacterota bacterium]|nr:polysaccharide lyase family protein [Verrucomicrobiota bacterium]HSA12777.1 polysaccharide lyase family protein [Candidatus Paceibacterota bacterium]
MLALSALTCAAADTKTLWQIGTADRHNAEFSLAPNGYERFAEDGFFIVGQSDSKIDWPYVHPGPADHWAGNRSHTYSILFYLERAVSQGTCRLALGMIDTHYAAAPALRLAVNGQSFERALPRGASDASIFGNPAAGKPCQLALEFPAALLRAGNNQINITSTDGSWFLYDSLALDTPAAAQLGAVKELTALISARPLPGTIERDGQSFQRIAAAIAHAGGPKEVAVRVGEFEAQRLRLKDGRQAVELLVPAVSRPVHTTCSVLDGRRLLSSQAVTLVPGVKEIVVVFKTHFDIGYTDMASNIVQRYRTTMIDQALDVVDQNRDLPPEKQFAWTLAGWPLHKILQDWPGQSPARKQRVERALRDGRFVVHGLPFTTHTELLEAEDLVRSLGYSSRLARRLGLDLSHDGKMTDVPEHTWMMATMLKHAGIDFLMIGCNGASAPLKVPWLYWWQGPDGSRLLTFYSPDYGTQLAPPEDWPYRTWLACLHTGDNHGPPRPDEVKSVLDQAAKHFPGVKIRIGRLSDFGDAILAEKPDLPVVRGDAPDTWIHGPMSDPAGAKLARNTRPLIIATEALNTQLRGWGLEVPNNAPVIVEACEQSLLYGEHTWGGAIYWIGNKLTYGEEFKKERAAGRFNRLEASWDEHTAYIRKAHEIIPPALANDLHALARAVNLAGPRVVVYNPLPWRRSAVVDLDTSGFTPAALKPADSSEASPVDAAGGRLTFFARDIPPMGYRTYVAAVTSRRQPWSVNAPTGVGNYSLSVKTLQSPYFSAKLDPARGIITSLVDKRSGRELAGNSDGLGLGQYLHERFDRDRVSQWCSKYVRGYMHPDFFKPNQPPSDQFPYQAASPRDFKLRFEETAAAINAVMESTATATLPAVTLRLILYREQPCADLEITLHDKPFEPWPEAGWLCLPLNVNEPQFHLGRLASIIDPARDVITGANRHLFGLNTGATMTDERGRGVGLCPIDYPLVSLDTPGCWRYSLDFVPEKPVAYVNLFNNQWSTNFRLWNRGTWTSRVRLWAIGRYGAEPALITPSLEARYPLLAAVADGAGRALPPTRRGLELSRKGILLTAYGANPDGPGTVLRLWEHAGQSGTVTVRLPEGSAFKQAQPVDLRGRPTGKPLPVRNGAIKVPVNAFAPVSLVFGPTN